MVKVLLTALVIYAIWFYFRNQKRIKAAYDEVQEKKRTGEKPSASNVPMAQDLAPCPKCGAYVAAGESHACETPPRA